MKTYSRKSCILARPILVFCLILFSVWVRADTRYVDLHMGSVKTLNVGRVTRMAVGRDDILSPSILKNGELLLIAKAPGDTDIKIWTRKKTITYRVHISPEPITMQRMIRIKVKVLEIDKKFKKEIGISWSDSINGPVVSVASTLGKVTQNENIDFESALSDLPIAEAFTFSPYVAMATSFASRIQLLEDNGYGRTLSEPTLVCRSGESASFHSGGEFPFVYYDQGEPRTEFKEYGVIVEVKPTADNNGNIFLELNIINSSIDFSTAVNGVPGLLRRQTESKINIHNGDTIAISGLLSIFDSKQLDKVPFLGDIPILNHIFKSTKTMNNRNELVMLVTPEVINMKEDINNTPDLAKKYLKPLEKIDPSYLDKELQE